MTVVTKRSQSERPRFQYKLNENHKGGDFSSINGINLTRGWKTFNTSKIELTNYLRTYNNPLGSVDYQVINPLGEEFVDQIVNFDTERTLYTRKELTTFSRPELTKICNEWLINPIKKRNEFLIDKIIHIQADYEEYQKEKSDKKLEKDTVSLVQDLIKNGEEFFDKAGNPVETDNVEEFVKKASVEEIVEGNELSKEISEDLDNFEDFLEDLEDDAVPVGPEIMESPEYEKEVKIKEKGSLKNQLENMFKKRGE